MAIVCLVIETIRALVSGKFTDVENQMKWKTETLASLFEKTTERAQEVVIDVPEYLQLFGYPGTSATVVELWQHILERIIRSGDTSLEKWKPEFDVILKEGTLSQRILKALGSDHSHENMRRIYRQLCGCLAQNKMFLS